MIMVSIQIKWGLAGWGNKTKIASKYIVKWHFL